MIEVAIDTETTGLNVWKGCRPYMVSMCTEDGTTSCWEWPVDPITRQPRPSKRVLNEVQDVVGDRGVIVDFFNAGFDVSMLASVGVQVHAQVAEVSFMARAVWNLDPVYALKPLALKYMGIEIDDESDLHAATVKVRRVGKRLGWALSDSVKSDYWMPAALEWFEPEMFARLGVRSGLCEMYAKRDAERTMALAKLYRDGMREMDVEEVYAMEMLLWRITYDMEQRGVAIDPGRVDRLFRECRRKVRAAEQVVVKANGGPINLNSPAQLSTLLFDKLRLPVSATTKHGQGKTDAETLMRHKDEPVVRAVLTHRANSKALTSFFGKFKQLAVGEGGLTVLHPGYRQWGTLTGRYSCADPNLQNVSDPSTTNSRMAEYVVDVKQVFIPRPGYVWYCPDYCQVEVIIFADIAKVQTMLDAITAGMDVHAVTAEKIWGGRHNPKALAAASRLTGGDLGAARALMEEHEWRITDAEEAVGKKTFRKLSKAVTFTKIFGGGPNALMSWIGVGRIEARRYLSEYDDASPEMAANVRELEGRGRREGCLRNPFGRLLRVDPWAPYKIVSHLVQSTAADLIKRGMIACSAYLAELGIDARIIMTVHDELIFEFRIGHNFKSVLRRLCELMADSHGVISVATPVELDKVTDRWSQKTKVTL